jgi:hypothetical protein
MRDQMVMAVGDNVTLVATSLRLAGQPDSASDYIVTARTLDGRHSAPIRVPAPGGVNQALAAAADDPWVRAHRSKL